MSAQKNFQVDQNTTFRFVVEYKDSQDNPIDLTGSSAKMQVRDVTSAARLAATLTSPLGGITIDPLVGKVTVTMTPTQTNKLFYPKSAYDLILIDSNSSRLKIIEGFLTLNKTVTI
jgi:hypothetical protein